MYEKQKDNFDTVRDGLLGLSGHDYKSDGLTIIRDRDQYVPEITEKLQGCESILYSSE